MNVVKLIARWIGAVLLFAVGIVFFLVGVLLTLTIVGIVPGILIAFGATTLLVAGLGLVAPDLSRRMSAWQSRTRGRVAHKPTA